MITSDNNPNELLGSLVDKIFSCQFFILSSSLLINKILF